MLKKVKVMITKKFFNKKLNNNKT